MIAQEKLKLTAGFEKLTNEYNRSYIDRRKELEDERVRIRVEIKQLVATVEAQRKSFEAQSEKLDSATEQFNV